jgi:biopolymer transport protein ExbB/TolQ
MTDGCPHCGAGEVELEAGGTVQRCRACGRSALRATTGGGVPGTAGEGPAHTAGFAVEAPRLDGAFAGGGRTAAAPGEVAVLPAAGIALVATLLFYGALRFVPETRLSELFVERGWVPYAISFVSAWALALLAAKRLRLGRERRLLERDWLARPGAPHAIAPSDVDAALAGLVTQRLFHPDAFLARRIVRALRHFQARRRVVEVVEFLAVESRADESRIDASYGLIRVFIWAVPTLGFIGTVIGIGAAVAGFSTTLETASSIDGMRDSIESVTGGLGVAFDTTLLALVMSILIMFPSSALQRLEESFLGEVDDYCAEHVVRRLADEPEPAFSESLLDRLVERLVEAVRRRDAAER